MDFVFRIPHNYRIKKKFFHEAIEKTFPVLSNVPIALTENDINWGNTIKKDETMQRFIKSVLLFHNNSFDEYLNKKELSIFLKEYFSHNVSNNRSRSWPFTQKIQSGIKRYKPLVRLVRKFRKPWSTSSDIVIFRLLTLKVWFDLFVDASAGSSEDS